MSKFVGNDDSAKNSQALAPCGRFERAVIYVSNQLSADEHTYVELQSGEPPHNSKNPVREVGSLRRY